jgi:predicted RNA binding protein YcfA (HicA-like mRNA interferase family)
MKVKEVIAVIKADGWYFKRQKGSHKVYYHPSKKGIVVVPDHGLTRTWLRALIAKANALRL